jgi:hypothetical protein
MTKWRIGTRFFLAAALTVSMASVAVAQVTPAAGFTPPDDNPSFKIGATIFADYTFNQSPTVKDADGNNVHNSSFNVGRAYINVTGNLNHWISFRITPDVSRETGTGSSLNGSQDFRLKYAFVQFSLDDWLPKGTWVRLGVQQTPLIDFEEQIYRYRFQGTTFIEREGYLTSSDAGLSGHYNFPGNYGDIHAGFYNGEGYSHVEANNEKAFQLRASVRPMPLGGIWSGLRVTGFLDEDHYLQSAPRRRVVGEVTFESKFLNAGLDVVDANDQTSSTKNDIDGRGWSIWATPRFGNGYELLLRHDDTKPSNSLSAQKHERNIAGVAYWFTPLAKVSGSAAAVMLDYDSLKQPGFTPNRAVTTNYGIKLLLNF